MITKVTSFSTRYLGSEYSVIMIRNSYHTSHIFTKEQKLYEMQLFPIDGLKLSAKFRNFN